MQINEKELAEFSAEWLEGGIKQLRTKLGIAGYVDNETMLFKHCLAAPILAHLAKRKMEEMGFGMSWSHYTIEGELNHRFLLTNGLSDLAVEKYHKNEYIALWLAIRSAVDV